MREPKKFTPEWFRYFRFVNKLTRESAAELFGVSGPTWTNWENGTNGIRKKNVEKITAYLKTNLTNCKK